MQQQLTRHNCHILGAKSTPCIVNGSLRRPRAKRQEPRAPSRKSSKRAKEPWANSQVWLGVRCLHVERKRPSGRRWGNGKREAQQFWNREKATAGNVSAMKHFLIVAFALGRWHTMRFLRRYVRKLFVFKGFTGILGMKASTKLCFILLAVITLCYFSDLGFLSIFHRVYQPTGRATAIATAMRFLSGGWNLGAVPLSAFRSLALQCSRSSLRLVSAARRRASAGCRYAGGGPPL